MSELNASQSSATNNVAGFDTSTFPDGESAATALATGVPRRSTRAGPRGIRAKPTELSIPPSFARGDPSGCTCIISVVHQQELELEVADDGASPDVLSGHLAAARWSEITLVPATLRNALSTAGVVDAEMLIERMALVRIGAKWNPAVRLLLRGELNDDALEKVWSICQAVLAALTQDAHARGNLKIDGLDAVAQAAVRESVEAALEHARGCSFDTPLIVQGPSGPASRLCGKLGRPRDRSNHAQQVADKTGRIGGLMHLAKANFFVLQVAEGPPVHVDFSDQYLRAESEPANAFNISLVELARMNEKGSLCAVRVHETKDAKGRSVYTFARWLPPPDASPAGDNNIMINPNTNTNS